MTRRTAILILAALLAFAACAPASDEEPDGASATETPTAAADAAPQVPKRPQPGTYVYDLIGVGLTASRVPDGSQLTESLVVEGDTYRVTITNNQNPNTQLVEFRWEDDQIVQVSNTRVISGRRTSCTYDPPLVALRIPIRQEEYREQKVAGCDETTQVSVVGREQIDDATGKLWDTWAIEVYAVSGGRTDEVTRWFSPELGRDVRIDTATDTSDGRNETSQLLRSYPSG